MIQNVEKADSVPQEIREWQQKFIDHYSGETKCACGLKFNEHVNGCKSSNIKFC